MKRVKLDTLIERLYYKHATGRQIDVLKISKIFDAGRAAAACAGDVEGAIVRAIAVYTEVAQ